MQPTIDTEKTRQVRQDRDNSDTADNPGRNLLSMEIPSALVVGTGKRSSVGFAFCEP